MAVIGQTVLTEKKSRKKKLHLTFSSTLIKAADLSEHTSSEHPIAPIPPWSQLTLSSYEQMHLFVICSPCSCAGQRERERQRERQRERERERDRERDTEREMDRNRGSGVRAL